MVDQCMISGEAYPTVSAAPEAQCTSDGDAWMQFNVLGMDWSMAPKNSTAAIWCADLEDPEIIPGPLPPGYIEDGAR